MGVCQQKKCDDEGTYCVIPQSRITEKAHPTRIASSAKNDGSGEGHVTVRRGQQRALGVGVTLVLLFGVIGCASGAHLPSQQTSTSGPTIPPSPSPTISADAVSRIHGASPSYVPLFASIRFTASTTYAQAVAIIGGPPYPYSCDGVPRTPEPAPQITFATSHYLLVSSQTWDSLLHLASSPQVVSVDGTPLYPCP
jgi:hypothetical protein